MIEHSREECQRSQVNSFLLPVCVCHYGLLVTKEEMVHKVQILHTDCA